MGRMYTEKEMKEILRAEMEPSKIVDNKMQEAYQQIRQNPSSKVRRRSHKKVLAFAAAAALVAATSVVALGANGFFQKEVVREDDHSAAYNFAIDYSLTANQFTMKPGYIPEGYTAHTQDGLKYDKDGRMKNGISLALLNAQNLDTMQGNLDVSDADNIEETTIHNMEAHIITWKLREGVDGFDKRIYLFNPTEGYVAIVYGGNDLALEELKKIAENLEIEKDESVPEETLSPSESEAYYDKIAQEEYEKQFKNEKENGIAAERVLPVGTEQKSESFDEPMAPEASGWDKITYTVKDFKYVDSLEGYSPENFYNYETDVLPYLNEDGTAKPYEAYTIGEDGKDTMAETMTIQPKFLVVNIQAKNYADKVVDTPLDLWYTNMTKKEDGSYQKNYESRMAVGDYFMREGSIYLSDPQYNKSTEEYTHFFWKDMQPQETLDYTLIFVVDEDQVGNICLWKSSGSSEDEFSHTYLGLE